MAALLLGLLALLPALGPASVSADAQPVLSPIQAVFNPFERATRYVVTIMPETQPTYAWSFTPPADDPTCDKFASSGNQAVWQHGDENGCQHVHGAEHGGMIVVVVAQGAWVCKATITGTLTHAGPKPDPCVARAGVAPKPPPLPSECKCTKVTMTTSPENFTAGHTFEFAIHWTITCTGAIKGTCRGEIEPEAPVEIRPDAPTGVKTDLRIVNLPISKKEGKKMVERLACAGSCRRKISRGTFHAVGKAAHDLELKARRGRTFLFKFKLFCADTGRKQVEMPALATMKVVYDKRGFIDRKKSDFSG